MKYINLTNCFDKNYHLNLILIKFDLFGIKLYFIYVLLLEIYI